MATRAYWDTIRARLHEFVLDTAQSRNTITLFKLIKNYNKVESYCALKWFHLTNTNHAQKKIVRKRSAYKNKYTLTYNAHKKGVYYAGNNFFNFKRNTAKCTK